MEDNKTDSTSDRDKKMMGSFESYATKREKAEKAKEAEAEKRRLRRLPGLFEKPEDAQDTGEDKEKTDIGALFEKKEPEPDEEAEVATTDPEEEEEHETAEGELELLDQEEIEAAIDQYVDVQLPEVEAEVEASDPESEESDVAQAEATLLRNIKETHSVEDGFKKTVEELDLDEEGSAEGAEDDEAELEPGDEESASFEDEDEDEDEEETPTPPRVPTAHTPSTPVAMPLVPPAPGPPLHMPPTPFNVPSSPNTQPTQPNTDPSRRRQRAGDVLVGGIIGYLIGRRRGRINTEAELTPVKQRLESEVRSLHEDIAAKEENIRKLAASKFEKTKEEQPLLRHHIENEDQQEALTRRSYESINQSDYARARPERLGHVLVPKVELEPEKPDVSKLSIVELLGIAANIKRDNISVRQMFESGRLDALGLRRVVHEYLNGQKFERVLTENLKMMESHEHLSSPRDNRQTDQSTTDHQNTEPVAGPLSLPKNVDMSYGSQAYPSATADYYQIELQKRRAATIGIGIGLALAVLVLFVLYLLI